MKNFLSLLLCVILCFSLFACNSEETGSTKKNTQASEENSTLSNNENDFPQISYASIDLDEIGGMIISSEGLDKSFSEDPESIENTLSYVNGLKLRKSNEEPAEKPDITIYFNKKRATDTIYIKQIIVYLFESGKKAGISNAIKKHGDKDIAWEHVDWYDVVDADATKPLEFLEELYKTNPTYTFFMEVKDDRLFVPEKEIDHIFINKYAKLPVYIRDASHIKNIVEALKNIKLYKAENYDGYLTSSVTIYFGDNSIGRFSLTPDHLVIRTGVTIGSPEECYAAEDTDIWNEFQKIFGVYE